MLCETSEAALAGHVVVFTGRLWSMSRREAQAHVCRLGGSVSDEVSGRTTLLVVGTARGGRPSETHEEPGQDRPQKLRRARAINERDPERIRILSEDDFCSLAGLPLPSALYAKLYPLHDVLAMYPVLREDQIRYLGKWGLVRPAIKTPAGLFFSFADLATLRHLSSELARGVAFQAVVRALGAEREGQMTLDFHAESEPARIVALRQRSVRPHVEPEVVADAAAAERCFAVASSLDNGEPANREAAARAYRKALEADPYLVAALINLGNLHYAQDELVEAQALYERAVLLAPDMHEAHFNLGNVHHDLGHLEAASDYYREAIEIRPDYAEAHFYLAVTLEKTGRSQDAKPHWRAYQRLAPDGEWIDLAREFSE